MVNFVGCVIVIYTIIKQEYCRHKQTLVGPTDFMGTWGWDCSPPIFGRWINPSIPQRFLNNPIQFSWGTLCPPHSTSKFLLESLTSASTNPQYDKRLLIDLPVQYMKNTSSEHLENMLCTQIVFCFCFDIQNNLWTQHVLSL